MRMNDSRSQSTYQVRLAWGLTGMDRLAPSDIVVVVDAIGTTVADGAGIDDLVAHAAAMPHGPSVFVASLRNATVTAQAIIEEQVARGGRTAVSLVLVGDNGDFAVEDFLAAGALGDALSRVGIDHTAPDLAVAIEGFRPLTRALKHLLSASAAGLAHAEAGHRDDVKAAAELDADAAAIRIDRR